MILSLEEQANTLARYLPPGKAFGAAFIDGTNTRNLLLGMAEELRRMEFHLETYRDFLLPDRTLEYIDDWEFALGIPDGCFTGKGTNEQRRRDILIKLASLGVQTESDFVSLAAIFGITVQVKSGIDHLQISDGGYELFNPLLILADFESPNDLQTARFTLVISYTIPDSVKFPYLFPLPFTTSELNTLECLFGKLKQAHENLLFIKQV